VIAQSVQRWATGWLGLDSRGRLKISLFTTVSRMALGPTQPPIQWAPGDPSLRVKRPGREADYSPPSSAEVKEWVELYLHSPNMPPWRGAQLKRKENFTFYTYLILNTHTHAHIHKHYVIHSSCTHDPNHKFHVPNSCPSFFLLFCTPSEHHAKFYRSSNLSVSTGNEAG
jgi:hypothetical protein